jgi:hypothetical protein
MERPGDLVRSPLGDPDHVPFAALGGGTSSDLHQVAV